ncbi:MAG: hypothetical protein ABFS37_12850 [Acidobacteriota bacterium]
MKPRSITVAGALVVILTAIGGFAGELYIGEYVEGAGLKKRADLDLAIEIVNPTGLDVDLAVGQYKILIFADGSTTPTASVVLSGNVEAGTAFVVVNAGASPGLLALADLTSASLVFDGNDVILLVRFQAPMRLDLPLDVIGQVGANVQCWSYPVDTCDSLISTVDATVRRSGTYLGGVIDPNAPFAFDPAMWQGVGEGNWQGLGIVGFGPLFADGFESGDMTEWSESTAP